MIQNNILLQRAYFSLPGLAVAFIPNELSSLVTRVIEPLLWECETKLAASWNGLLADLTWDNLVVAT